MPECARCPMAGGASRPRWVAPRRAVPLSGIVNVDKPPHMTSHDVVNAVRRMAGQRKVGHAGTLDPMATGVLLVCLGRATRVAEYLMAGRKRYLATIVLGTTTDTYDAEGKVVSSAGPTAFAREEIESALVDFVGSLEQVPPIYSALKRDGQPLYKLARKGQKVELEARAIEIEEIALLDWTSPSLVIRVDCSPGTYIRSLAHDLGQRLGSGAHLGSLARLASGRFTLEEAVSLERLEEAFRHGQEGRYLLPLDEALIDWPALIVDEDDARRVAQGQAIRGDPPAADVQRPQESRLSLLESPARPLPEGSARPSNGKDGALLCRAYSLDGDFLAVMAYQPETGLWRPKKVFASG